MTMSLSVFVYQMISLTARPILFSFTVKLLIGHKKVYNCKKGFSAQQGILRENADLYLTVY